MNNLSLYTRMSPLKLFMITSIPGIISMVAASLWGLFEGIFVARSVGELAFAAVNLGIPIVFINFSLADLIGVGSSVHISIALGNKNEKEANNFFTCSCLLIFLAGIAMGLFLYFSAPAMIRFMGAEGDLAALAATYIRSYAIWSPISTIVFAVDNYLRICGKIKSSMTINIFMSMLITGMLFLCLSVLDMGVFGAGFAICFSMSLCAAIALYPFVRGKLSLHFTKPVFSLRLIGKIISGGSPIFLSNVSARLTSVIMNMVLLNIGGATAVSAYGILLYAGEVVQPILYGACDSLQPAIGYNFGAREFKRVIALEKCCLIAGAIISVGGALIMMLLPDVAVSLFSDDNGAEIYNMARYAMRIFGITYLTRWLGFSLQGFFIALDKPLPATLLSVGNAFIFPLLLLTTLWPLKLLGIWLNAPLTSAVISLLAVIIYFRIKKTLFKDRSQDTNAAAVE